MQIRLIIPARRKSTRLPNKPLIKIAGVPMIVRTFRQCTMAYPKDLISVATDDAEIAEVCRAEGADVVMTSDSCLTGTDRIAEAALSRPADYFINVQGDEPLFNPDDIRALVAAAEANPERVLMGYAPIASEDDFRNPSIPKMIPAPDGRLLYTSRNAIPTTKKLQFVKAWRQICAYGFPPGALAAYSATSSKTPVEAMEDLEGLRFLELGYPVYLVPMSDISIAVDHPSDVELVEAALAAR